MRVGIVGSRKINLSYEVFKKDFKQYVMEGDTLVSGGAEGVDSYSQRFAKDEGYDHITFLPYFKLDKKEPFKVKHFFIRNRQIVNNCDTLIAYWDGESSGTRDTIQYAIKKLGEDNVVTVTIPPTL